MTDQELIQELEKAASRWEKENPIIGVGRLRYCDALRDAAHRLKELCGQLAALQAENAEKDGRISRVEAERDTLLDRAHEAQVERDCARAERDALVKARNEGLVVVLPCRVGDTVYAPDKKWSGTIGEIVITDSAITLYVRSGGGGFYVPVDDVHFSRTEAEAALGGGGDGL